MFQRMVRQQVAEHVLLKCTSRSCAGLSDLACRAAAVLKTIAAAATITPASREYGRTNYGVSRNADHSNVTPSRKPLRHTTRHGRLNPSSGTTNANLTGIAPALATSSADPVADKSRTTQSIFSRSYSILAGFAMRKRGAIRVFTIESSSINWRLSF
jgi:hypothetical protein